MHEYEVEFWDRTKPNRKGIPSWDYSDTMTEVRKYKLEGLICPKKYPLNFEKKVHTIAILNHILFPFHTQFTH